MIKAFSNFGYEGSLVTVEVDLRRGIPAVDIVGLADGAVKERFKDNNGWWHSYIAIYAHGLMLESDFNNIQKIKQGIKVEGLEE